MQTIKETRTHPDAKVLADLKKRKLIRMQKVISFKAHKGPKFALEIPEEATDLTAEMIASGSWKTATFKPYNFKAQGAVQNSGALHPLNKVRAEFREIFFEMGFEEMPTSKYVFTIDPSRIFVYSRTDGRSQVCRVGVLELRRSLRTAATSSTRSSGHLLHLRPQDGAQTTAGWARGQGGLCSLLGKCEGGTPGQCPKSAPHCWNMPFVGLGRRPNG